MESSEATEPTPRAAAHHRRTIERSSGRRDATDGELAERAQAGDRAALGQLYDRYVTRLHSHAWYLTNSHADASDIVQDCFVIAAERIGQLRDVDKVRPWLYAIIRSEVHRRHRRVNRLRFELPQELASDTDSPEREAERTEAVALLRQAEHGLTDSDRRVLDLYMRQGLVGQELSDALGVPFRHISVIVDRVRERLARSLSVLLLAHHPVCEVFAKMAHGQPLTPLSRKRLSGHIAGCAVCTAEHRLRIRSELLVG